MKNLSPGCCFIFGFGYTAQFLTNDLSNLNFRVIGTTREPQKIADNNQRTFKLVDYHNSSNIAAYLAKATHLLISIPPIATSDPVLADFSDLIKINAAHIQWLGYLSSTSVYGDHQGRWVDENADCLASDKQSLLRLNAEKAWLAFARQHQLPLHIFRLAGIYGPGRNTIEQIKAGKKVSIYKARQFFSRIHVTDIVSVLLASINNPKPYSIYNVADDKPSASHVVDAYACDLLKQPHLPCISYAQANLSPMATHFYANNRRIINTKIKNELNVKLNYPTYHQGLSQLFKDFY